MEIKNIFNYKLLETEKFNITVFNVFIIILIILITSSIPAERCAYQDV
jgi:hypothetical protein